MVRILNADEVRRMRMRSQRLSGPRATDVPALLQQVGALQAQDTQASRLAVRPRSDGLDAQAVPRGFNLERPLVRTSGLRGGLDIVAPEDGCPAGGLPRPDFAPPGRYRGPPVRPGDGTF